MKTLLLDCLAALVVAGRAHAALLVLVPTSTAASSLQITAPIVFVITKPGNVVAVVFDEWVPTNGEEVGSDLITPDLAFSLNGAASRQSAYIVDNQAQTINDVTPNNGYFFLPDGARRRRGRLGAAAAIARPESGHLMQGVPFVADNVLSTFSSDDGINVAPPNLSATAGREAAALLAAGTIIPMGSHPRVTGTGSAGSSLVGEADCSARTSAIRQRSLNASLGHGRAVVGAARERFVVRRIVAHGHPLRELLRGVHQDAKRTLWAFCR